MDKNIKQIEKYKNVFDKCINKSPIIKKLILKGWFIEWVVIGIIIWQFFIIYKLHQILTAMIQYQYELSMLTGNVQIIP